MEISEQDDAHLKPSSSHCFFSFSAFSTFSASEKMITFFV